MPEPDEWLMLQVRKGSTEHLDSLIRRYANAILTYTTRLTGSPHRGEEAFQEVFMAVWMHRRTYAYPRFFRPWLYRIAHNKCRQLSRGRDFLKYRYDADPDPEQLSAARPSGTFPNPSDVAVAVETNTILEKAVALLPTQQRSILVMHLWNQMSYTEIADALGIEENTVRSTMHYALQGVRRYLEPRLR